MQAHFLLVGAAVAVGLSFVEPPPVRKQQAGVVQINVRVDCLAGRGVSFSLTPWVATVQPGDSISWMLDEQSNAESLEVVQIRGNNNWPFAKKLPYRTRKGGQGVGARALDSNQKGNKYKYAVQAICTRTANPYTADTVLIDPDIIIIRGGGT
jgi:hypothetical protein